MKKKILLLILLFIFSVTLLLPNVAFADMGPKPSVTVEFTGLDDEGEFFVTLLSSEPSTGPFSVYDPTDEYPSWYADENPEIWQKFVDYVDADGYYFLQYFEACSATEPFSWTYYPPQTFKVLIYLPQKDTFIVSGVCERYAFDSNFLLSVTLDEIGMVQTYTSGTTVEKHYDFLWQGISLLARIVGTIGLELLIALIFRFTNKKQILLILYVNLATQILLNVGLNVVSYFGGAFSFVFVYALAEWLVFLIEAALYTAYMPKCGLDSKKIWLAWIYSFVANLFSFGVGVILAIAIPGVFFL